MRFNYIVIVVVLVGSAFLARLAMRPQPLPGLQADLVRSLDAFWGSQGSQVEVLGSPDQAEVRASVAFPAGTTPRQEEWMQEFVRFVARRHPGVKVGSVRVTALGEAKAEAAAPDFAEVTQVEMLQQQLQGELDAKLGAGMALILLAPAPAQPQANRILAPVAERAPGPNGGAPLMRKVAPAVESRVKRDTYAEDRAAPATTQPTAAPLGVLVVQTRELAAQAVPLVNRAASGLRVVVLP